jgi:hypothetical protein
MKEVPRYNASGAPAGDRPTACATLRQSEDGCGEPPTSAEGVT